MTQHAKHAQPAHCSAATNVWLAVPGDLPMIVDLQRKFSDALGFIPRAGVEQIIRSRSAIIATQNGQPAGALLYKPLLKHDPRACPILQAAVYRDAQRRHHGLSLVEHLAQTATRNGSHFLQCWARDDLPDLDFWTAAGFHRITTRPGGSRRDRPVILFRRPLRPDAAIYTVRPDPIARTPGGQFAPPAQPSQMTLWPLDAPTGIGR